VRTRIRPRSKPRPGRLKGDDLTALRDACFDYHKGICGGGKTDRHGKPLGCGQPCNPLAWEMAHIRGKRNFGDKPENVVPKHPICHQVYEHRPKSVPRKQR